MMLAGAEEDVTDMRQAGVAQMGVGRVVLGTVS